MEKQSKTNKHGIIIIILVLLVILALGYIFNEKLNENSLQHDLEVFQNGTMNGQILFYNTIMQELAQCKQFPLPFQNQTVNLVLVECLNQGDVK